MNFSSQDVLDVLQTFEDDSEQIQEFLMNLSQDVEEYVLSYDEPTNDTKVFYEKQEIKQKIITDQNWQKYVRSETELDIMSFSKKSSNNEFDKMTIREIFDRLKCRCEKVAKTIIDEKNYDIPEIIITEAEPISSDSDTFIVVPPQIQIPLIPTLEEEDTSSLSEITEPILTKRLGDIKGEMRDDLKDYLGIKTYAIMFVDELLKEAVSRLTEGSVHSRELSVSSKSVSLDESITMDFSTFKTVPVVSIKDFTPKIGQELIKQFIFSWLLTRRWSYFIKFLGEKNDACNDFYIYEVLWSIPTKSYPIPQVTASVFFTVTASRIVPRDCPIKVTYTFESEKYEFNLLDAIQHEKFLINIINCKTTFFKRIRF